MQNSIQLLNSALLLKKVVSLKHGMFLSKASAINTFFKHAFSCFKIIPGLLRINFRLPGLAPWLPGIISIKLKFIPGSMKMIFGLTGIIFKLKGVLLIVTEKTWFKQSVTPGLPKLVLSLKSVASGLFGINPSLYKNILALISCTYKEPGI